jgi:hypothetical protein
LDVARRLDDPVVGDLSRISVKAARRLNMRFRDSWDLVGALAAHLAGAGKTSEALAMLDAGGRNPPDDMGDWTTAWAWRGLAWSRLGNPEEARRAFETANRASQLGRRTASLPRTSREWKAGEMAYALADRWPEAFRAAESYGDESTRVLQRCKLIDLWVARGGGRVSLWDAWRPWRGARPPAAR